MFSGRPTLSRLALVIFSLLLALSLAVAKKKPPAHPININTASASELEQVPGIGPSTAQKILDTRKSYGSFQSVDDLLSIKGIGQKRLDKMRKYLTVAPTSAKHHTTPSSNTPTQAKAPPTKTPAKQTPPPPAASEDDEP